MPTKDLELKTVLIKTHQKILKVKENWITQWTDDVQLAKEIKWLEKVDWVTDMSECTAQPQSGFDKLKGKDLIESQP